LHILHSTDASKEAQVNTRPFWNSIINTIINNNSNINRKTQKQEGQQHQKQLNTAAPPPIT